MPQLTATEAAARRTSSDGDPDMPGKRKDVNSATMLAGQQGMSVEQARAIRPRRHRNRWHPQIKPIALWRVKKRTVVAATAAMPEMTVEKPARSGCFTTAGGWDHHSVIDHGTG